MLRIVIVALVAGCSAAAPAPRAPAVPAPPPGGERWIFRQLRIGPRAIASRTTFELAIDGGRASLVEIDESALRVRSADPSSDARGAGSGDDRGAWEPPATVPVQAMVCDAGIVDPDADADDALMFARAPGLEYVSVTDRGARSGGLRVLR